MRWRELAERAAWARTARILARIETAIAELAPSAKVERDAQTLRVRGRGLKLRWIGEPGLRFARRIGR